MEKSNTENKRLRITRMFNAPIELVWEAWTNPEHIANWWGPDEFTSTIHKMDFREGGEWLLTMHGPDGTNYPNRSIFKEIVPMKKIVFEHFNPDFVTTVIFTPKGKQTLMEWSMLFKTAEMFEIVVKAHKADKGLEQNAIKLEKYLNQKINNPMNTTKITVETTINANSQKAWDFYTQPKHIIHWNFASDDWQCPKAENDLKAGGKYFARMEAKDGSFGFDFEAIYDKVISGKELTYTLGDGRQVTTTFENGDSTTKITTVFDAEGENPIEMQQQGWQMILNNYKKYVEAN